jgi:hypothetical protein
VLDKAPEATLDKRPPARPGQPLHALPPFHELRRRCAGAWSKSSSSSSFWLRPRFLLALRARDGDGLGRILPRDPGRPLSVGMRIDEGTPRADSPDEVGVGKAGGGDGGDVVEGLHGGRGGGGAVGRAGRIVHVLQQLEVRDALEAVCAVYASALKYERASGLTQVELADKAGDVAVLEKSR